MNHEELYRRQTVRLRGAIELALDTLGAVDMNLDETDTSLDGAMRILSAALDESGEQINAHESAHGNTRGDGYDKSENAGDRGDSDGSRSAR